MSFWKWSRTAASNGTADSTCPFPEGMAPSAVNDGVRGAMAALAMYRDDIAGAIVTAGTSAAYTVSSYSGYDTLTHLDGQMIAFTPNATNTNAVGVDVTLNVDSLGAKPIRAQPSIALPNGSLVLGTPYVVLYNNSDGAFYLQGGLSNPYNVPLAGGMDFWGTSVPNSSFAFPAGQAISRTTYATLFAIMSTTYGVGDGSTTFNLPDKTGRVSAMKEASATRLTSGVSGVDGATMGSAAGSQSHTLTTAELPVHSHANSLTDPGHTHNIQMDSTVGVTAGNTGLRTSASVSGTNSATTGITISNANAGSGSAHAIVQPTIICNYIIRII